MEWWLKTGLLAFCLVWFIRLVRAVRQRRLTRALLKLLQRIDTAQPGLFDSHSEVVAAAQQAVAASAVGPSSLFRPSAWLRANLAAARAVMLAVDAVDKRITESDQAALTLLLNAEQKLLARNKLAFSPNPGSYACRHVAHPPYEPQMTDQQWRELIPHIRFHTEGNRAYSRRWCRHCLVGFEDQWAIAVSGGH
jgi:hypothetical protein